MNGICAGSQARFADTALLLLPGVLTVYLSFNQGGFFAGITALATVLVAAILVARAALADGPLIRVSRPLALAGGALILYSIWVLVSAAWSDALGRALIEFDRVLLYVLVFLLFGSVVPTASGLRSMVRGLLLASVIVSAAGLITYLFPSIWPTELSTSGRLAFPLTYTGSLGLLAALGIVWAVYLATSHPQAAFARVLGASALPLLATTMLLTVARAAIVAVAVGVIAYVVIARPRALLTGLFAALPPTAIALVYAYEERSLFQRVPTETAPVGAPDVALVVAACAVLAGILRAALVPVDRRVRDLRLSPRGRRGALAVMGGTAVALMVGAVALGAPQEIERQYERLLHGDPTPGAEEEDARKRLTGGAQSVQIRVDYWNVALEGFTATPAKGQGAGTYANLWARGRPAAAAEKEVEDAHSLYLETLAELGVVGLVLLLTALATILLGLLVRARGRDRSVYGVLFAAALAWAVHAAIDWDWEMPAVTLWLFAAGGAALAATRPQHHLIGPPSRVARFVTALALLGLALVPALILTSQIHLRDGQEALSRGDCADAVGSAQSSISILAVRPEPYETIGYCNVRLENPDGAIDAFRRALDRDPNNWQYWYGLAIARGAAKTDPRPAARKALELNPLGREPRSLVELFKTGERGRWKSQAEAAPLPLELLSQ